MGHSETLLGILAALGSAASWALGAVLFKRLGEEMSSFGMTLAKMAVSVVLLGAAVLLTGWQPVGTEALGWLAVSGIIGIAIADTCFFKALQDLGPVAMIVLMVLGQVLMILIGVVWFHEQPSALAWAGIGCVLAGVVLAVSADLSGESRPSGKRGLALGLASVLCMSIGYAVVKEPLAQMSSIQATFIRMSAGAAGLFIGGGLAGQLGGWLQPLRRGDFVARFLLAVCVVTFGGFWLSLHAMQQLGFALANTLNSTEPIFVLPLAYFVLKERIKTRSILGALLVVAGVALIFISSKPTT